LYKAHKYILCLTGDVPNVTADDVYTAVIGGLTITTIEVHLNYCRLPFSAIYRCRYGTIHISTYK